MGETQLLHTVVSYLRMALPFIYLIGSWRFGDWRNWRNYYPSVLFFISVDFFISILTYEYPLWTFQRDLLVPNHTVADFIITFSTFTQLVYIYLSRYPYQSKWLKQTVYVAIWILIEAGLEKLFHRAKLISYDHGWNFAWSCLVWAFMFVGIRLHHTKPFWAWLFCFACAAFLILYFHIPIVARR